MIPHKVLTAQDYQKLASKLIDDIDPENFIEQSEREYLSANRNFYTHLEKAVSDLYYPMSKYENLPPNLILLPPPDNEKTEKTLALVKAYAEKSATKTFDVSKYQFELKHKRIEVTQEPGKVVHFVCCENSIQYLKGLAQYVPNEKDFAIFENVFTEPHKLKIGGTLLQMIENHERLDFLFKTIEENVQEISRADLKEYFFECVEKELNIEVSRQTTGKFKFPMMKFLDRLEAVKQAALNDSSSGILETEGKETNPNFTTARQVLAVHYLLEYCQVKGVDQTQIARFIEFLTGKNFDNIYKAVRSPLASKVGNFRREDLQFIRPFFENLGLAEIVKMINNQLEIYED